MEVVSNIGWADGEVLFGIVVPLTTDGCVDAGVGEKQVFRAVNLGLSPE